MNNPYMFRCPADIGKVPPDSGNPNILFDHLGISYYSNSNSNWYGNGGNAAPPAKPGQPPWVLYGTPYENIAEPSHLYSVADATIMHAWSYWAWQTAPGPHGNEFNWHDPRENHPGAERRYANLYFYDPNCAVGFLDGHASYFRLGPYRPIDDSMNRDAYIADPNY